MPRKRSPDEEREVQEKLKRLANKSIENILEEIGGDSFVMAGRSPGVREKKRRFKKEFEDFVELAVTESKELESLKLPTVPSADWLCGFLAYSLIKKAEKNGGKISVTTAERYSTLAHEYFKYKYGDTKGCELTKHHELRLKRIIPELLQIGKLYEGRKKVRDGRYPDEGTSA
ncbi:hypothetical protein TRICI_003214 [Trichomonascus ciferrii]|uniref:Uncharacterized protein n=1 Tax=Trichomonascus ciferrii TaxID=44093 RepID=A0A642VAN7_9ASCO|nr:hypothetical protein TRICI_003214 [Trichomonascus ciferrii]